MTIVEWKWKIKYFYQNSFPLLIYAHCIRNENNFEVVEFTTSVTFD